MAQRFYRQNIALYNPLSFEEMLFAPSMMRQKHDALDAALMDTQTSLGQFNALSQDRDFAQQAVDPVSQELNQMAEQLAKEGFNNQSMSSFRKLKTQRDKLFSPTGEVGIAQSRLAAFQEKAKELKEQYKDDPKIADFWINQLAQSPGLQRDIDGNIINQGLNPINNVRHYDAKEINDILDSQIGNIKADLVDLGFSDIGDIGTIQDIWVQGEKEQISKEKIANALFKQLSPEIIRSAQQAGLVHYGDPNKGLEQLEKQILGIAEGGAYSKTKKNYSIVTNEDRKRNFEKSNPLEGLTRTPGPRISRSMQDVLKDNNLTFDDKGNNIVEAKSNSQKIRSFFDSASIGPFAGWKIINQGVDELGEIANIILEDPSMLLHVNNPAIFGTKINSAITTKEQREKLYSDQKERIKKDMTESVANYKKAYPELSNMTNEEVYEMVLESRNNFSELYSEVIAPKDMDFNYVNDQILGKGSNTGDLFRRQIFAKGQSLGTGEEFIKKLGYDSYSEFKENGKPQMEAGIIFGGKSPGSFILNALDSEGNPITAEVQSNNEISEMAQLPNEMLNRVQEGVVFKEIKSNDNDIIYSQVGSPDEGNSMYFMFDVNKQQAYYIEAPQGLNPQQVKAFADENEQEKFDLNEAINTSILKIFYGQGGSSNILRK